MKLTDFLVFKSEYRVDWKTTQDNIMKYYLKQYSKGQEHLAVLSAMDTEKEVRKLVKRYGVQFIYLFLQEEKREKND